LTVAPGSFTVRRNPSKVWYSKEIVCTPGSNVVIDLPQRAITATVAAGDNLTCIFAVDRSVNIRTLAYNDLVRNGTNLGKRNAGDPWLENWGMAIYSTTNTVITSSVTLSRSTVGLYDARFYYLPPGSYTACTTLPDASWLPTTPAMIDPTLGKPCKAVTLAPGQSSTLLFGAYQPAPNVSSKAAPTERIREAESIGEEDAISDLPYDPAEDQTIEETPFAVYRVSAAAVGGGAIQVEPQQESYLYGDMVTLTAIPEAGSVFSGWRGAVEGNENPVTVVIDDSKLITGVFDVNRYNLTLNQAGNGSGTVGSDPSESSFLPGTVVTLQATANPGSTFAGWSGDVTGNNNPVAVVMDGNKVVTALFTRDSMTSLAIQRFGATWSALPNDNYSTLGYYDLVYRLVNNSTPDKQWRGSYLQVTAASNALLLNPSDGVPAGIGATMTVPDEHVPGGDGLWQAGEVLPDQWLQVGVIDPSWRMTVAIYGVNPSQTEATGQSAELLGTIELDEDAVGAPLHSLYLPLATK